MWNHIVLLLFCLLYFASAFLVLNQNIDIILKPKSCREDLPLLTIIHSAPKNVELRQAIRESWVPQHLYCSSWPILMNLMTDLKKNMKNIEIFYN